MSDKGAISEGPLTDTANAGVGRGPFAFPPGFLNREDMEQQTVSDVSPGSSPAPVTTRGEAVLESMNSTERATWEKTGDLPAHVAISGSQTDVPADSSPASTPAASSPASPGVQAASTDAQIAPASEPGTPQKPTGHKGNAETRIQELLIADRKAREEIARLNGQIEALSRVSKPDAPTAGSSPDKTPTKAEYQRYLAMPDAPKEEDFENYREFSAAMGLFITDKRWQEHETRAQQHSQLQRHVAHVQQVGETAAARVQEAIKADPAFASKVDERLLAIEPASVRRIAGQKVGPQHVLVDHILQSDHTDKLLLHFSTEPGQHEWAALCALPPDGLLRAFGRLEARFEGSVNPAPAPKHVSSAPAPPAVLGGRAAEAVDPVDAAIRSKDPGAYIREANKRELAAMGR